eukprot:Skav207132  [mRNA]  locus=scaffold554:149907:152313:+ [translate_table: standard]
MGCACSKASQASQPGQDAQDLPRVKLGAATRGDVARQREGASKASGSEVHETQSSEADSPAPQRSVSVCQEGGAASCSQPSQGCALDQTQSAEASSHQQRSEALGPIVEDFGVTSSFCFCCPPWESELPRWLQT